MASKFITREHFSGQGNTTGGSGREGYRLDDLTRDAIDDRANLFAMIRDIADKLDADAGVTDTDYRAVIDAISPDSESPRTEIVTA